MSLPSTPNLVLWTGSLQGSPWPSFPFPWTSVVPEHCSGDVPKVSLSLSSSVHCHGSCWYAHHSHDSRGSASGLCTRYASLQSVFHSKPLWDLSALGIRLCHLFKSLTSSLCLLRHRKSTTSLFTFHFPSRNFPIHACLLQYSKGSWFYSLPLWWLALLRKFSSPYSLETCFHYSNSEQKISSSRTLPLVPTHNLGSMPHLQFSVSVYEGTARTRHD